MFDVFLRVEPKTHAISAHGLFQWLFVCHCVFFFCLFFFFFVFLILAHLTLLILVFRIVFPVLDLF